MESRNRLYQDLPWLQVLLCGTPDRAFRATAFLGNKTPSRTTWASIALEGPRRIFVNSMSDLFHEKVPIDFINQVFDTMRLATHHVFQVLTKRPDRLLEWQRSGAWPPEIPPNIWLGVSVESNAYLWRVDRLREADVQVRFISAEPLLGSLANLDLNGISWVITGGESGGPPDRALVDSASKDHRPKSLAVAWVREIRDLCRSEGVAFFHKQWGGPTAKSGGRVLDGREWSQYPSL